MSVPTQHLKEREANMGWSSSTEAATQVSSHLVPSAVLRLMLWGLRSSSRDSEDGESMWALALFHWIRQQMLTEFVLTSCLRQRLTWAQVLTTVQGLSLPENGFIIIPIIYSISWWSAELLLDFPLSTAWPPRTEPCLSQLAPELGYATPFC